MKRKGEGKSGRGREGEERRRGRRKVKKDGKLGKEKKGGDESLKVGIFGESSENIGEKVRKRIARRRRRR